MKKYVAANGEMEGFYEFWLFCSELEAAAYLEDNAKEMAFVGILELDVFNQTITQIRAGEINWPRDYKNYSIVWDKEFTPKEFSK